RLKLARELGAEHTINPREKDPVSAIHDLTDGDGAECTMDCTGLPEPRAQAVRSADTWGRVAFVGEGNNVTLEVSKDLLRRQITLHASWTFSNTGQEECARFIERAQVQGNVSAVCRELGISRTVFYRWRNRLERYGVDGVHPRRQRAQAGRPVATAPEVERLVLAIAISAATWGCRRIAA